MTIEEIQKYCLSLKGVTQDIKWEDHLCFNIGEKMFLITSPDKVPPSASFKVTDEDFERMSAKKGFQPAPYLARYKWIYIDDINLLPEKEWKRIINQSYELISSKLPTKIKKQLKLI